ncbi:MAG: hypothetical protein AB1782_04215 [Cyanobacteriota bacterium]
MSLIEKILQREEFKEKPPVLIDIGASNSINPKWKKIAKYSICIAFEADNRDIDFVEKKSKDYKKLFLFNKIVIDNDNKEIDFYLTKFPYCSSVLKPDSKALEDWVFSNMFEVNEVKKFASIKLNDVLNELDLTYVDWFKTDSQGIDLRLFKSLGKNITDKILAAEFEPGILDSYNGEDKLHELMQYMDTQPFWMSDIGVKGVQRISKNLIEIYFNGEENYILASSMKTAPGWAEVTYTNDLTNADLFDIRDYLLSIVFALIDKQYGFAFDVSVKANEKFKDPLFEELNNYLKKKINNYLLKQKALKVPKSIIRRLKGK